MAKKVKIDGLTKAIAVELKNYADHVTEQSKEAIDEISKEAQKIVKNKAPSKSGKYKRSIKVKKTYESLTEKRNTIFADNGQYRLTHLLERGHAKLNGGRTRSFPHWKYGDEYIKSELPKRIEKKLGGK